ncbi:MAG: hypothetical protein AAGK22_04390 [Acidobacteriota bacterium]
MRRQIAESKAALAAAPGWLGLVEALDREHVFGRDGLAFSRRKQRSLWDLELLRSIPSMPEDSSRRPVQTAAGPLQTLVDTAHQLEGLGIDFLVVPVPPRAAVFADWLPGAAGQQAPAGSAPLDLGLRELYLRLEESGVEVLDLLPLFREQRSRSFGDSVPDDLQFDEELVFRRQDVHWSSFGSELAAAAVAERIRRYPWAAEIGQQMGRARLVESRPWRRQHGSIVASMIRRGQLSEMEAPLEVYPRYDARIEGERWTFYDPSSPIVLLGDSFSRPEHSFPQHLLKELGYRVDVLAVPLGNQSAQLGRLARNRDLRSKRLVVWQIAAEAFVGQKKWRSRPLLPPTAQSPSTAK